MQAKCRDIVSIMEEYANPALKEDWDNVGLLVGEYSASVNKVLIALDAVEQVVDEAIQIGANMIITHHPIIFKPVKNINDESHLGKKLLKLIKNNICVYCSHTNLDIALGGTNDTLFDRLDLINKETLKKSINDSFEYGLGRVGELQKEMTLENFAGFIKEKICANFVNYIGDSTKPIKKVGICTGSSASIDFFMEAKNKGCDVYITGDITYHIAQIALEMDLCLIDATHYYSEDIVTKILENHLKEQLNKKGFLTQVYVSQINAQVIHSVT